MLNASGTASYNADQLTQRIIMNGVTNTPVMGYVNLGSLVTAESLLAVETNLQGQIDLWRNPTNGITQSAANTLYLHPNAEIIVWQKSGGISQVITNMQQLVTLRMTNAIAWQMRPITTTNSFVISAVDSEYDGHGFQINITRPAFNFPLAGFFGLLHSTNIILRNVKMSGYVGDGWSTNGAPFAKPYAFETRFGSNYVVESSTFQIENVSTVPTNINDYVKAFVDVTTAGQKSINHCDFVLINTNSGTAHRNITFGATHGNESIPTVYFSNCRFVTSTTNMLTLWNTPSKAEFSGCKVNCYLGTNVYAGYGNYDNLFLKMDATEARSCVIDGKQTYSTWIGLTSTNPTLIIQEIQKWTPVQGYYAGLSGSAIVASSGVPFLQLAYQNYSSGIAMGACPPGKSGKVDFFATIELPPSSNPLVPEAVYTFSQTVRVLLPNGTISFRGISGLFTNATQNALFVSATGTVSGVTNEILSVAASRGALTSERQTTNNVLKCTLNVI